MKDLPASFTDPDRQPAAGGGPTPLAPNTRLTPMPAPATQSDYRPPAWMRNRHLQTIWPAIIGGGPRITYRRERWQTPDQDFIAGVSLGANAMLKWLGEQGAGADFVRAAAGVSAPQNLHAGAIALSRGINRLYCLHFLRTLRPKSLLKLERFPGLYDRRAVIAARDFFDFDDAVTAPLHGFADAIDYWTRSSCKQHLRGVAVPALVLNARNDPFLPESELARPAEVSRHVVLEYPAEGGHVGFVDRRLGTDWLPQRLMAFFRQFA